MHVALEHGFQQSARRRAIVGSNVLMHVALEHGFQHDQKEQLRAGAHLF